MQKADEVHEVTIGKLADLFGDVVLTLEDGQTWKTSTVSSEALEALISTQGPFA